MKDSDSAVAVVALDLEEEGGVETRFVVMEEEVEEEEEVSTLLS